MSLSVASSKKAFKKLCGPAQFYLVISLFGLLIYLIQMLESKNKMNTVMGFSLQVFVIVFWTISLNSVCMLKYGNKIAWFLVLLPIIFIFTMLIIVYHAIDTMGLTKEDIHKMIHGGKMNRGYNYEDDDLVEGCGSCGFHN